MARSQRVTQKQKKRRVEHKQLPTRSHTQNPPWNAPQTSTKNGEQNQGQGQHEEENYPREISSKTSKNTLELFCPYCAIGYGRNLQQYPYPNNQESKHLDCSSCTFEHKYQLKKHFEEFHLVDPLTCDRCYTVLHDEEAYSNHRRAPKGNICQVQRPLERDAKKMTYREKSQVDKVLDEKKPSEKPKMQRIMEILFTPRHQNGEIYRRLVEQADADRSDPRVLHNRPQTYVRECHMDHTHIYGCTTLLPDLEVQEAGEGTGMCHKQHYHDAN